MTKFPHSKRAVSSVYSKSLNFTERNSSKDLTLQRHAHADICNIDILFRKAPVPDLVFNEVQALSLQLYCNRRCFPMDFVEYLRTPFFSNSSGRLLLTLQVHKSR